MIERCGPRPRHRLRMMSPAAEHVGRRDDDERLASRPDEAGIEVGQEARHRGFALLALVPNGGALR